MKALYLESVAGVAGDMFAASFLDAGLVTEAELMEIPRALGLEGVYVEITRPLRATMRTSHLDVRWQNEGWKKTLGGGHAHGSVMTPGHSHSAGATHWHTHYVDIDKLIRASKLDEGTRVLACRVFRLLAESEAQAHGVALEDVAFHEVGTVDSVVDVAMAAFCVRKVGAERVLASPVKLGRGHVKIEHGVHPVPPPASARLSIGFPVAAVPASITRQDVELSTPTGLAILKALEPEFVDAVPAGRVLAQGMGSGTMDLGIYPNVFRVMLLETTTTALHDTVGALPYEHDSVVELSCNVDDESPERVAWLIERLLERGALDAWASPFMGKKGRSGFQLCALAQPLVWKDLADWLLRHSSTFGLRYRAYDRLKLARRIETRDTPHGQVRFKVGLTTDGAVIKEKAEYEDLKKVWETDPDYRP